MRHRLINISELPDYIRSIDLTRAIVLIAHNAWKQFRAESGGTLGLEDIERVEKEVLPPWREARQRLEAARSGPLANYFPEEMERFYQLRERSWEALIEAVRTNDKGLFEEYDKLFEEAEAVGEKVMEIERVRPVAVLGQGR